MEYSFSILYDGNDELIVSSGKLVHSELGTLLISFLSMDFSADSWERLLVGDTHPHIAAALSLARDSGAQIGETCRTMDQFRLFLSRIVDTVLVNDKQGDIPCTVKLSELCRTNRSVGSFFQALSGKIRADITGICGDSLIPLGGEPVPEHCLFSYSADGLQPLLLLEIEVLAAGNCVLKHCENCGGYFRPYSGKALYCDRLIGQTGKTCKELASREKYEQKVASDEALTLIQRRSKTFAMRASRSNDPAITKQYREWRLLADTVLTEYKNGTISFEELSERLKLPALPKKKRPQHGAGI